MEKMENTHTEVYDLSVLMRQGDLFVERVATASVKMSAGEYFDMLSEMIERAPTFSADLD